MVYSRTDDFLYEGMHDFFDEEAAYGYYQEEPYDFVYAAYESIDELAYGWADSYTSKGIDGLTLGILIFVVMIIVGVWMESREDTEVPTLPAPPPAVVQPLLPPAPPPAPAPSQDPAAVAAPYDHYVLTQGLHGYSYGHAAIDIKAGQGAVIKSPITGKVSALFIDEIGNPTLVIENDYYQVTMMHGVYTVTVGDQLTIGQPVGTESNLGNTKDWLGNSCRGRDCGYHTHLNIFDKRLGTNINPLDLISGNS